MPFGEWDLATWKISIRLHSLSSVFFSCNETASPNEGLVKAFYSDTRAVQVWLQIFPCKIVSIKYKYAGWNGSQLVLEKYIEQFENIALHLRHSPSACLTSEYES